MEKSRYFSRSRNPRNWLMAAPLGLAAWLLAPSARAEHAAGALWFVNRSTGTEAFGYIDTQGQFQQTYLIPGPSAADARGITKVITTPNGFLTYHPSGRAYIEGIANTGFPYLGGFYGFSAWDDIVSLGDALFFYRGDGAGALGYITPAAQFVQWQSYEPGTLGSWSHIASTTNHYFLYNRFTGAIEVAYVGPDFNFTPSYFAASGANANYDYLVTVDRFALLYSQSTGIGLLGGIDFTGRYESVPLLELTPGYNKLVQHQDYIILYNSNEGGGTIGYVDPYGTFGIPEFVVTDRPAFSGGWTHIVSTGEDLLFYNSISGVAAIGHLNALGQFQQTQSLALSANWGFISSTVREDY